MKDVLHFTVASALLDELGQRLVGRPSIALAELIKNAFDADATLVKISMSTKAEGKIVIRDNGHGMTLAEFKKFWMAVGTTHKLAEAHSRNLERPLTGSKGVGRISARLLSRRIEIETIGEGEKPTVLQASLNWDEAQASHDQLTQVTVPVETHATKASDTFTEIRLLGLRQAWTEDEVKELAREIWYLQPPFEGDDEVKARRFKIEFASTDTDVETAFREQVEAIKTIWHARIRGRIEKGKNRVALQFREEKPHVHTFDVPSHGSELEGTDYEILVYYFRGRQAHGIGVKDARQYVEKFSGVHIYDRGFRLPYYGQYETDWLALVQDQARSLTASKLLPESLQFERGLLHLPPLKNVVGAVHIKSRPDSGLEITIQRDRLKESATFNQLRDCVRASLDWYAQEQARTLFNKVEKTAQQVDVAKSVTNTENVLKQHEAAIPKPVYAELRASIKRTAQASETLLDRTSTQVAVLGSLATAGISALAFQHELLKQIRALQRMATRLGKLGEENPTLRVQLKEISEELTSWSDRVNSLFSVLGHLRQAEHVNVEKAYPAKVVADETWKQIASLVGEVGFVNEIPSSILLPKATYAEWASVFQNAFYNALNAMLDEDRKNILVTIREPQSGRYELLISDTGCGVDLEDSEALFQPFVRKSRVTTERSALQLGGTGLGLPIVRMIVGRRGARVAFVEPVAGHATTLQVSWEL